MMFDNYRKLLSVTAVTLALAISGSPVNAQNIQGILEYGEEGMEDYDGSLAGVDYLDGMASDFIIKQDTETQGATIKLKSYNTKAVGQNKNWDLDIGSFQEDLRSDPNQLQIDNYKEHYTGMRLKLPFRGRIGR